MTFLIRPAKEDDMAFVVDSWRKSFEGSPAVRGADREHYRVEMTRAIRRLCDKATILVACDPGDEDTLVGFAAFTEHTTSAATLEYVYVKRDFRHIGVARQLLAGVPITAFTFLSAHAHHREGWAFKPRFTI